MKLFILAAMAMVAAASIESNIQELDLSFLMKDFPSLYPAKKPTTPKPEPKKKFRPFLDMFPDRSKLQIPKLKPDEDVGKALILTPMIKAGKIAEAVKQSKVEGLFPGVESHSGFFQIDPKADANLFFWYFPAEVRLTSILLFQTKHLS